MSQRRRTTEFAPMPDKAEIFRNSVGQISAKVAANGGIEPLSRAEIYDDQDDDTPELPPEPPIYAINDNSPQVMTLANVQVAQWLAENLDEEFAAPEYDGEHSMKSRFAALADHATENGWLRESLEIYIETSEANWLRNLSHRALKFASTAIEKRVNADILNIRGKGEPRAGAYEYAGLEDRLPKVEGELVAA